MPDPKELPYLLKLLDDESEVVREAVAKELEAFGESLEEELARLSQSPDMSQQSLLRHILEDYRRNRLKGAWLSWLELKGDNEKLETAFSLLSDFQNGRMYTDKLKNLLDQLADEFRASNKKRNVFELSRFLFKFKALKGAKSDYYNPRNSNLVYVIKEKRGLPISLASIYILVGHRLGLKIEGCDSPGHFLARTFSGDEMILVDCFNDGRFLSRKDIEVVRERSLNRLLDIPERQTDAETIIARVLRNLINAFHEVDELVDSRFMMELLEILDKERREE